MQPDWYGDIVAAFLVSFTTFKNGVMLMPGSHVLELPGPPVSKQAALDIQSVVAMEYGAPGAILLNWDMLPDSSVHPSGGRPYIYFLSYVIDTKAELGFGSRIIQRAEPICDLGNLRVVEESIRSKIQAQTVHLLSCKALRTL